MAVGVPVSKSDIDLSAGSYALDVDVAIERALRFKDWLDTIADATLQAAPYSYTSGEVAYLRSSYGDIAQLATIYKGTATLGVAKDFRTFSKILWGIGVR